MRPVFDRPNLLGRAYTPFCCALLPKDIDVAVCHGSMQMLQCTVHCRTTFPGTYVLLHITQDLVKSSSTLVDMQPRSFIAAG